MNKKVACLLVFAAIVLLGFGNDVRAASLYGKVIEVNDGDTITVFNLNRPVKVRLMGIDAPELGQPLADVAKHHLKQLVMDRMVLVEYSGLGMNSLIVGRVTVDGADVCAQMIRDGVAWFDVNNNSRLNETDRQIYMQSEAAAKSEKRGIWQNGGAVPPWEFARSQVYAATTTNSRRTASSKKLERTVSTPELTPEQILGPGYVRAGEGLIGPWLDRIERRWRLFEPSGQHFSILVPEDGRKTFETTLFRDQPINTYAYMVHNNTTMFAVVWLAGPHLGESDDDAVSMASRGMLMSFGKSYEKLGENVQCEAEGHKVVSAKQYIGREFSLSGCHRPGMGRIYTRLLGDQRQIVMLLAFYNEDEPNVNRFLKSFKSTD